GTPAKQDKEPVGASERAPGGRPSRDSPRRPHAVRHDHRRRAVAVRVLAPYVAAESVQEPVQLTLRVMESPCAAPAVGAAIDGFAAKFLVDATEFMGERVDGTLPTQRDEGFHSTARVRTGAAVEPAGSHHRLHYARRMS